jgi:hypothetical protein
MSKFTAKLHEKRFYTTFVSERDILSNEYYWDSSTRQNTDLLSGSYGIKLVGKVCFGSFIIAAESPTKKQIKEVVNLFSATNLVAHEEQDGIDQFKDYYFICSLRKIPISRLTSAFPHAKPSKIPGRYTLQHLAAINRIDTQITIDLISPIESSTEALAAAKRATEGLPHEKTNKYTCFGRSKQFERPHIWFRRHKFYQSY